MPAKRWHKCQTSSAAQIENLHKAWKSTPSGLHPLEPSHFSPWRSMKYHDHDWRWLEHLLCWFWSYRLPSATLVACCPALDYKDLRTSEFQRPVRRLSAWLCLSQHHKDQHHLMWNEMIWNTVTCTYLFLPRSHPPNRCHFRLSRFSAWLEISNLIILIHLALLHSFAH